VVGVDGSRPLAGVRVVDFTQFVSGPFCSLFLADLGADVVKVEPPGKGDPYRDLGPEFFDTLGSQFVALNCGKRSLAVDFKVPRGLAVVRQLIAASDILVENSRPGALARAGLGYAQLHDEFPRLIYGSVSAYGATGPRANDGGFDLVLQAETGLMDLTGDPDGPPTRVGAPVLDILAGAICAAGILAAYIERERTGQGHLVETSLLQAALTAMSTLAAGYLAGGSAPRRSGNHSPLFAPYGAFQAADGAMILAGAGNDDLWRRLCEQLGLARLVDDQRFATNPSRVENRAALAAEIEAALASKTRGEWNERLRSSGVPGAPINSLAEALAEPQTEALGLIDRLPHPESGTVEVVSPALVLSGQPLGHAGGPARLGAHTRELLMQFGYSDAEIATLAQDHVVRL
jgi:crotonobetainyl-CoA:carnitine CoA-transferase CaiB-like acyl-CoA transferase